MNVGIFKIRIDRYTYLSGGIRPLLFQVVGGRYHGELTHHTAAKKFTSQGEGKSGFTGTRGCHRHKVTRVGFKIFFIASVCQARKLTEVPHGARPG